MVSPIIIGELVERLISKWPGKASWIQDTASHPHEAHSLRLDTSKTIQQLRWQSRLGVAEVLDWIVEWYVQYFDGAKAKALCLDQIQRFEKAAPAR